MATASKAAAEIEWISLGAAAKRLGESRLSVLTRAVKGEVEARHIAGRTLVSRASVDKLIRKQG